MRVFAKLSAWANKRFLAGLILAAAVVSCGDTGPVKRSWGEMKGLERIVGNMNDTSYSSGRTQEPRPNADGKPVSMTDFEGRFVWSEYAATWCPACAAQTPVTREVEKDLGDDVVFLTVMTGRSNAYNDHATVETAKQWTRRFRLDPDRVLAAELWYKTVPEHRFYSPRGHTLFVHVGFLAAEQIREVIAYYRTGYEEWERTGKKAKWMS
jgi:thiol-disulfide isomerase/thioredoxin